MFATLTHLSKPPTEAYKILSQFLCGFNSCFSLIFFFVLQGYFRRGCALYGLGKYEESVVALLQCLALDTSIETAKEYLSKVSIMHYTSLVFFTPVKNY